MRTHLSLSSCTYTCSYLQWEWLRSARRRSKCCTGLWQRSKVSLCNVEFDYVLTLKTKTLNNFPALYWFLLAKKKNTSEMFFHDPEHQWVLMPFPILFWEDINLWLSHINLVFIYTLWLLLYQKSYSLVRFLPHLLMVKYHVPSMKYFLDVTLFIPK